MKKVDIARLRGYDIQELLKHEIRSTSFCLIKVGMLRKSWKSELAQKSKNSFQVLRIKYLSVR